MTFDSHPKTVSLASLPSFSTTYANALKLKQLLQSKLPSEFTVEDIVCPTTAFTFVDSTYLDKHVFSDTTAEVGIKVSRSGISNVHNARLLINELVSNNTRSMIVSFLKEYNYSTEQLEKWYLTLPGVQKAIDEFFNS